MEPSAQDGGRLSHNLRVIHDLSGLTEQHSTRLKGNVLPCSTRRRRLSSSPARPAQRDGNARSGLARSGKRRERNLIFLDASDVLHSAFAVNRPRVPAEGKVSSRCGQLTDLHESPILFEGD
jgi:hypothetical protein